MLNMSTNMITMKLQVLNMSTTLIKDSSVALLFLYSFFYFFSFSVSLFDGLHGSFHFQGQHSNMTTHFLLQITHNELKHDVNCMPLPV